MIVATVAAPGCMTTGEYAGELSGKCLQEVGARDSDAAAPDALSTEGGAFARLQSPADESNAAVPSEPQLPLPLLPDPGLTSTTPALAPLTADAPRQDAATPSTPIISASPPSNSSAAPGNASALQGLSSISRNRQTNRMRAAAPSGAGSMLDAAAAGRLPTDGYSQPGGMSSILRNRIEGVEGEPRYTYPDIHDEPGKRYHDRFGIDEDHDRFLFPWLMNLIFEDRWLLSEKDPTKAVQNQYRQRMKIDIRDPDPDTANFPNGAYTLPKGRLYIETSPLGLYGASKYVPRIYQWESLVRYGMTDNLEFRIFSNGFTARAPQGKQAGTTGVSPLAFDFKANFWEENTRYHIPAMGLEAYIQTNFGSPAFNSGTQPAMNLLFDQTLPFEINFEYNFGITGVQDGLGQTKYQFGFQWSFQRQVVKDFDVFVQGFYNEASLPRLIQFRGVQNPHMLAAEATIPTVAVIGAGAIWTVNNRLAIFGSYNFGLTPASPRTIALLGCAVAF
jgi:hypothetical protein